MTVTQPVITFGYEHLEAGAEGNPKNYRICGARTRNPESKYPVCTQRAGHRTAHPGVGRCVLHGGNNLTGPDNPNWKGGRYAHIYKGRLKQHFEALQADTSDPLDLLPELEVQRLLLAMAIEDLQKGEDRAQAEDEELEKAGTTSTRHTPPPPPQSTSLPPPSHPPVSEFLISTEKLALVTDLANNVVKTVTQIIVARNQTALTLAEIKFLRTKMMEGIERFIPDIEQRTAFIRWLIEEIPGGDDPGRLEIGEGSDSVQAAGEAG